MLKYGTGTGYGTVSGKRDDRKMGDLVIVRGGGDIATGTIHRLYKAGFEVLILETETPSAIRREAAFSEAIYEGRKEVEGVVCERAATISDAWEMLKKGRLTILADPGGTAIFELKPEVVVDAILAKKNLGTYRSMALLTIGLGPGFTAGKDVDVVIETMRGHDLGRLIRRGSAMKNTNTPGSINGITDKRVIYARAAGKIRNIAKIGDNVKKGDPLALIETPDGIQIPVKATIDGVLRGIIRSWYEVTQGLKIADIDPRVEERKNCFTISDKSRCIAGSVLEAIANWKYALCTGKKR